MPLTHSTGGAHARPVAALASDLLGDAGLPAGRVESDDAAREVQERQQARNGRDLAFAVLGRDLPERHVALGRPRRYDAHHRVASVVGASEPLAVDGDDLPVGLLERLGRPGGERALEMRPVDEGKHARERVVRRDAAGERHDAPEPVDLCVAEGFDGDEGVGPAGHGAEGEGEDVGERVASSVLTARIWNGIEVSTEERQERRGESKPLLRRSE